MLGDMQQLKRYKNTPLYHSFTHYMLNIIIGSAIMIKIFYDIKTTSATTTYMTIEKKDWDYLIAQIIGIQSYMSELSISSNQDIKDLTKWFTKPNKSLPFHSKFKKHNSPQSFISGTLNNVMFGTQRDLSEIQAQHLQMIINTFVGIVDALKDLKIDLQKCSTLDTIMFAENLWSKE